jgi:hypothetical protein
VGNVLTGLNTSTILLLLSDCCTTRSRNTNASRRRPSKMKKCRTRRTETSRVAKGMRRATADQSIPDVLVKCVSKLRHDSSSCLSSTILNYQPFVMQANKLGSRSSSSSNIVVWSFSTSFDFCRVRPQTLIPKKGRGFRVAGTVARCTHQFVTLKHTFGIILQECI